MKKPLVKSCTAVICLAIGVALSSEGAEIVGNVVDDEDKAISGVVVSAYRDSALIGRSDPTNDAGYFELKVDGGPIDAIEFRKPGFHMGLIKSLDDEYAQRNNSIIKILYKNPEGSSNFAIRLGFLLNYENFFYLRTSPSEPNKALEAQAAGELMEIYSPLVEKLAPSEKMWNERQIAIYDVAYRRVAALYRVK